MFIFKKIIGALLSPGSIILILLSIGLLTITFSKKFKRFGLFLLFLGTLTFYLFTTPPLPNALISALENQYQPLEQVGDIGNIKFIVVLSGDLLDNSQVPPTSQNGVFTACRVIEAIRLFHLFADKPLMIMSGGGEPSSGKMMVDLAESLNVPADKLLSETKSLDTYGNAREVKPIVQDAPFLLVTSASHLPRAMIIFKTLGMRPIPAPANYCTTEKFLWHDFFHSGRYLEEMKFAIHEYLGLAYLKLFPKRAGK
jgi:uncharacterized SAM-binding protein YcdF (DUF218 family)